MMPLVINAQCNINILSKKLNKQSYIIQNYIKKAKLLNVHSHFLMTVHMSRDKLSLNKVLTAVQTQIILILI